jgi:hypothetical protein
MFLIMLMTYASESQCQDHWGIRMGRRKAQNIRMTEGLDRELNQGHSEYEAGVQTIARDVYWSTMSIIYICMNIDLRFWLIWTPQDG